MANNPLEKNAKVGFRERMAKKYKAKLSLRQYRSAYEARTEPSFDNDYFDNTEEGLYKSVASEVVVFSSKDKYDAGTGWPCFMRPAEQMYKGLGSYV